MKVAIRADSSLIIGTGHIMRCLTIAEELRKQGTEVTFVCREHVGSLSDFIEKKTFKVCCLPKSSEQNAKLNWNDHATWLGVPWKQDAEETISALQTTKGKFDWLIVDHYALDSQWEKLLRPLTKKIMVIDDIADRFHDCDFLLDHNLYQNFENRYDKLVPMNCYKFLGPRYALLRPEFAEKKNNIKVRNGTVKKIFVFMGGADPTNETRKILNALNNISLKDTSIKVVLGSTVQFQDDIKLKFHDVENVYFFSNIDYMAELMGEADLAIGGGGVTSWERCSVMLPSIVIALAENQVEIAKNLEKAGAAVYLGRNIIVSSGDIEKAILKLLDSPNTIKKMSLCAGSLVDGNGLTRVIKKLNKT